MTLIVSFEIIFILLFTLSVRIFILYKRCFTRCTRLYHSLHEGLSPSARGVVAPLQEVFHSLYKKSISQQEKYRTLPKEYYSQYEKLLFSIRETVILNTRSTILMARIVHLRKE